MPATAEKPDQAEPLKVGVTHERVGHLQNRLTALGHSTNADSNFGPRTHSAVVAFQQANGLKADGIVGPATTEALRNGDALKQQRAAEAEVAKNGDGVTADAAKGKGGTGDGAGKAGGAGKSGEGTKSSRAFARKIEIDHNGIVRVYYRGQPANAGEPASAGAPATAVSEALDDAIAALTVLELAEAALEVEEAKDSMRKASTPEPFSSSKTSNWVARAGGLPAYIQHIAHDIVEKRGKSVSQAIQIAIGVVKRWARGGGGVDAGTKAAAAKAVAEWAALKAKNAAKKVAGAAKRVAESRVEDAVRRELALREAAVLHAELAEAKREGKLKCPKCDHMVPAGAGKCPHCDHDMSKARGAVGDKLTEAALTSAERKALPKSAYVFPDKAPDSGAYPIHDVAHAKNALARCSGKPEEARVKAAVYSRYPALRKGKSLSESLDLQEAIARRLILRSGDGKFAVRGTGRVLTPGDKVRVTGHMTTPNGRLMQGTATVKKNGDGLLHITHDSSGATHVLNAPAVHNGAGAGRYIEATPESAGQTDEPRSAGTVGSSRLGNRREKGTPEQEAARGERNARMARVRRDAARKALTGGGDPAGTAQRRADDNAAMDAGTYNSPEDRARGERNMKAMARQRGDWPAGSSPTVDDRVEHPDGRVGTVVGRQGSGASDKPKVRVKFDGGGEEPVPVAGLRRAKRK